MVEWLIFSIMFFIMVWMGYQNSTIPKCWGDPIPFSDALLKIPRILALTFVMLVAIFAVGGIGSGD